MTSVSHDPRVSSIFAVSPGVFSEESVSVKIDLCTYRVGDNPYLTLLMKNTEVAPSFDFLWQLQNLLMVAEKLGHERVSIRFDLPGRLLDWVREGIIEPLMGLFGVSGIRALNENESYSDLGRMVNFPVPWNGSGATSRYAATGKPPFRWKTHPRFDDWANTYRDTIVITLRNYGAQQDRNSNLDEWVSAAKTLKKRGERVVFVPDAFSLEPSVGDFEIVNEAALSLWKRAAIYAKAKANLFPSCGPATLCVCMPEIPYVFFATKEAVHNFEYAHLAFSCMNFGDRPLQGSQWQQWHGFDKGEPGPNFRGPQQLWLWENPTAEAIVRGYDIIMAGVE